MAFVLGSALDYRKMTGQEASDAYDRQVKDRALRDAQAAQKFKEQLDLIKYNNSLSQDRRDAALAQARFDYERSKDSMDDSGKGGRWFQGPNGELDYFTSRNPPPAGWTVTADPSLQMLADMNIQDKVSKRNQMLAGYEAAIQTGKANGRTLDDIVIKQYAELYNAEDPNFHYVERTVPRTVFGKEIPNTEKKVWVKEPRIPQAPPQQSAPPAAPPAAIEYLKAHPEMKDQFKSKYGYLPEGF